MAQQAVLQAKMGEQGSLIVDRDARAEAARQATELRNKHPSMAQFQISFRLHSTGPDGRTVLKIP